MYDDILELLHSSDPKDRIRAIKEIARTEDPSLLTQLALIHKNDHDPEVREMALKAGRYIRSKQQKVAPFVIDDATVGDARLGADGPEYEMTDAAASIGDLTRKKKKNKRMEPVSAAAEKRAKGLVDRAMNFSMSGKNDMAAAELRKALHINPNLANDEYTTTLAAEVMGLPKDEAIDELMYSAANDVADDGITWETALADLATYGLVIAIIVFVGGLLISRLFGDMLINMMNIYMQDSSSYYDMQTVEDMKLLFNQVSNPSIPGLLLSGLSTGVFSIIGILFWYGVVHFVSTNFMSGMGSFRKLIHKMTPFLSIINFVQALVLGVMFFFLMRGMSDLVSTVDGSFDQQIAVERSLEDALNVMQLISWIFSIVVLIFYSKILGETYEFGAGKGCVSLFISSIMMVVVACGCAFLFSAVAGSLFSNLAMGMSSGM
ncbi:MAG: hypothetical protein CL607_09835 [Anaerolineaceae bacterium]|nr:hypothetical protein [Anaerolineaceae bacterium]